jgi:UDP-N-acetylglucosamine 4,6-dehydratase
MNVQDKSVVITGGTGSFGQAMTEYMLASCKPRRVIILSRDELKQYEMQQRFPDERMRFFLGDVRDGERLKRAFDRVDVVIHAAALKQVPAAEYNPFECIKTNVIGAQNVIDAAISAGVERVIALSTDKAASPVNLYGASKLCSDKLFISGNAYSTGHGPRMAVVRYGNVVGSRGSVVPLFRRLAKTGRLTITDPRMTRFLITVQQGVRFVLECLHRMRGGELFVPKIPSADIMTIAEAVAPGCETEIVGIRNGEKLHELMITEDDSRHTMDLDAFYMITPQFSWWDDGTYVGGKGVPEGFSYRSDTNPQRLTVEEVRDLVGPMQAA